MKPFRIHSPWVFFFIVCLFFSMPLTKGTAQTLTPSPPSSPGTPKSPGTPSPFLFESTKPGKRLADLLPTNSQESRDASSFCDLTFGSSTTLNIYIKNNGFLVSPPTKTAVIFSFYENNRPVQLERTLNTQPIKPGESKRVGSVLLPPACLRSSCTFEIIADAKKQAAEKNKSNNSARGICTKR